MSIVGKIKDKISTAGRRALAIDELRFKLDVALEKLNRIDWIEGKLARIEVELARVAAELARSNEQIQNLKSFLTWYSNRVEPWFWSGNFSQTDPEEELAGLLFNFLPGRTLVDIGAKGVNFVEAAEASGYEVRAVEPPNTIASLAASHTLPAPIDFLRVARESFDVEMVKSIDELSPEVIQTGFICQDPQPASQTGQAKPPLTQTEIISEMRNREYYWNVTIFRTEAEGFIRLATNLASVPSQAWGSLFFFRDHQLFLKAFHWCKTTLPRFRAAPLAR